MFYWLTVLTARIHLNPLVMTLRKVVYCRFFQFWLIFPNRNYKSRSIEYNFNWCWHHAVHLKKQTLPIFENLVTTLRTTTKVVSCVKIPLTNMCVVVRQHDLSLKRRIITTCNMSSNEVIDLLLVWLWFQ